MISIHIEANNAGAAMREVIALATAMTITIGGTQPVAEEELAPKKSAKKIGAAKPDTEAASDGKPSGENETSSKSEAGQTATTDVSPTEVDEKSLRQRATRYAAKAGPIALVEMQKAAGAENGKMSEIVTDPTFMQRLSILLEDAGYGWLFLFLKPHAILGPSGWDRWGSCPGSVPLTEDMDRSSSRYAREGTAAHQLLEDCLTGGFDAEDLLDREYDVEGELFTVDMDMADAVNTALAWIAQEIDPARGDVLLTEQDVPIAQLTGEMDATGASDVIGIVDEGRMLVVMDYKHGQGVQVYATEKLSTEAFERGDKPVPNGQLAMYGLGSLFMLAPIYEEIENVRLVVMQPRLDWHDEITLSVEELLAFGERVTLAAGAVELARLDYGQGNVPDLVPSDKACQFCKAKSFCPALANLTTNALALASEAEDFEDLTLPKKAASVTIDDKISNERLAEMMRAEPLISAIFKDVRAEVERRLFDNQLVPGFYLGEGRKGNRQWSDERQAALELTKAGRLKVDEAFDKKVIPPTKAEKQLKDRPKIWSKIAPLIVQSGGKPSVCKEGDANPPAKLASSIDEFENLAVEQVNPLD